MFPNLSALNVLFLISKAFKFRNFLIQEFLNTLKLKLFEIFSFEQISVPKYFHIRKFQITIRSNLKKLEILRI